MRIGYVTTWRAPCGIATYSEQLVDALVGAGHEVFVLAPQDAQTGMRPASPKLADLQATVCWSISGGGNIDTIPSVARHHKLDVIHFQHEHGLFRHNTSFINTLRATRKACKVVVTLHTMRHYGGLESSWYDALRGATDALVVHGLKAKATLTVARVDGPCVIRHIMHGTPAPRTVGDSELGAEYLSLTSAQRGRHWCVVLGFLGADKNVLGTVRTFAEMRARRLADNLGLILVGEAKDPHFGQSVLPSLIDATGCGPRIVYREGFVPVDKLADIFALASFGMLNTQSTTLSASGQVHNYAAHGVPLIVANRPIYEDAIFAGAPAFDVNIENPESPTLSAITTLAAMLLDPALRRHSKQGLLSLARATAWPRTAERHVALYTKLLAGSGATEDDDG